MNKETWYQCNECNCIVTEDEMLEDEAEISDNIYHRYFRRDRVCPNCGSQDYWEELTSDNE